MNVVSYDNFTFDDNSIISGKLNLANSLAFDSLVPDEMTIEVVSKDTGEGKVMVQPLPSDAEQVLNWYTTTDYRGYVVMSNDIRQYVYGTPVLYRYDGVLVGKFYLKSVTRLSEITWRINMISAVGLWANRTHMGGVYNLITANALLSDVIGDDDYTVDSALDDVLVSGYLPIASVRDNLQQVLFAVGAGITKDPTTGNIVIRFLDDQPTVEVANDDVFVGSSIDYDSPVTGLSVTEHEYYKSVSATAEILFDNNSSSSAASDTLITFGDPCYELQWNGTSVDDLGWDNGANYCYVTGNGVLTGKKYTHIYKSITKTLSDIVDGENIKTVTDATLVTSLNVYSVIARLSDYYTKTEKINISVPLKNDYLLPSNPLKTGSKINFVDPYDGESVSGMVETMDVTMSGKLKADCSIAKGYSPSRYYNDFSSYTEIMANFPDIPFSEFNPSTSQWMGANIPDSCHRIRLVVIGGGQGGQGGTSGDSSSIDTFGRTEAQPGEGGIHGVAGNAGKVLIVDLPKPSNARGIVVVGGKGGVGSDPVGFGETAPLGADGLKTTAWIVDGSWNLLATYTSDGGEVPEDGYRNPMLAPPYQYAVKGVDGIDGGNGGTDRQSGEGVSYDSGTWTSGNWVGGSAGATVEDGDHYFASGGAGGGAAYGSNGGNGTDGIKGIGQNAWAGDGGAGANASTIGSLGSITHGSGGNGGCGGGGGGVPGYLKLDYPSKQKSEYDGNNGPGGEGSKGQNGHYGCVIAFFSSMEL